MEERVQSYDKRRVVAMLPGDGYEAVFTDPDGEERAEPIDFIVTVGVIELVWDKYTGVYLPRPNSEVFCLDAWQIKEEGHSFLVSEFENFVRLQKKKEGR